MHMKRLDKYLLIAIVIVLSISTFQRYQLIQLDKELQVKQKEVKELEVLLARTNKEYDELFDDYIENAKIIAMSPVLRMEWELKHAENQVRGVDGKLPRERD